MLCLLLYPSLHSHLLLPSSPFSFPLSASLLVSLPPSSPLSLQVMEVCFYTKWQCKEQYKGYSGFLYDTAILLITLYLSLSLSHTYTHPHTCRIITISQWLRTSQQSDSPTTSAWQKRSKRGEKGMKGVKLLSFQWDLLRNWRRLVHLPPSRLSEFSNWVWLLCEMLRQHKESVFDFKLKFKEILSSILSSIPVLKTSF